MASEKKTDKPFDYNVDRFADIEVLRYKVPDFENLTLNQKLLIYYLSEAAITGRDMLWDQNNKYNLQLRSLLEKIYTGYRGPKDDKNWEAFRTYMKQVWFGNGVHHHYSTDKFKPGFSREWLNGQIAKLKSTERPKQLDTLLRLVFDPSFMAKRVNQAEGQDLIVTSANNLYEGVTQQEVEDYYNAKKDTTDLTPVSWGLNAKVTKDAKGNVVEQVYKIGGLYSEPITRIVALLNKAKQYAENPAQRSVIEKLVDFYTTGDLKKFDDYSIAWVDETASQVDFINGFIESYGDPLGMTGSWESIVNYKNQAASQRTETISANAQWFEDRSPVDPRFRKPVVKGVSAKVINAAILAGDSYPSTPIGINLPNSNWVRAAYGSKSVTIGNLTEAYNKAAHGNGFLQEFVADEETLRMLDQYQDACDDLHTDLHECLGHGSGQLLPGVDPDALKAYGSTIEEARADLFGLYYLADEKLTELGLTPDADAYKAQYYGYMMNGLLTQLVRIEPGKDIEEAHMRNRALIARWTYEKGKKDHVAELIRKNGKTYVRINDYKLLRTLFGQLLGEIQRIKSEGDYEAARDLVEQYAVGIDRELHEEILERYRALHLSPYKGFINPVYVPKYDERHEIADIEVTYGEAYDKQMLRYSRDYATLPYINE